MENNNQLFRLLYLLKKSSMLILTVSFLFGFGTYYITKIFIPSQYKATVQLIGRNEQATNETVSSANLQLLMVNTYKELVKSSIILGEARNNFEKDTGKNLNISELQKILKIDGQENSQIFTISVTYSNPKSAKLLVGKIGDALVNNVSILLGNDTKLAIISPAESSYKPVAPNIKLNSMLGFLLGMLLSVGIVYVKDIKSSTLEEFDSISDELGLKNLGNIANQGKTKHKRRQMIKVKVKKIEKNKT
ncbi:hypothetical protein J7G08_002595 [Enterococcus faecalis]|nr:hypothetical protein [Enterococcus faecalis]EHH1657723.1 hypothetical protein [Enterococcus faecalis]EHZ5578689.1 hypothetical protein [Enterococcus faecalis]